MDSFVPTIPETSTERLCKDKKAPKQRRTKLVKKNNEFWESATRYISRHYAMKNNEAIPCKPTVISATAKQDTMDSLVKSIADLTDANARLTKTNQSLTQQLQKKGGSGGGSSDGGGSSSNSGNQTKT